MCEVKQLFVVLVLVVSSVTLLGTCCGPCYGQDRSAPGADSEAAAATDDTVGFLKLFHIGMTYADVQAILPKGLQQEVPSYNVSDNVFLLNVGRSSSDDWGAYFVFDTGDGALRKPEHLIEIDCSTTLAGPAQDFETLVREVSGAYGTPVKLDASAKEQTRTAGWRVHDDSVLTLEYTRVSNTAREETCLVDFVIRRLKYRTGRLPQQA